MPYKLTEPFRTMLEDLHRRADTEPGVPLELHALLDWIERTIVGEAELPQEVQALFVCEEMERAVKVLRCAIKASRQAGAQRKAPPTGQLPLRILVLVTDKPATTPTPSGAAGAPAANARERRHA